MSLAQYSMNWATNLCGAATNFFHGNSLPLPPQITVIQDVQIWDGEKPINETSITIQGSKIFSVGETKIPKNAKIVQGDGGFLMPGLIDAHVHATTGLINKPIHDDLLIKEHMKTLVNSGITTAFDMGSFPSSKMPGWRDRSEQGLTSLLFSGAAACVKKGFPAMLPHFPDESIVTSKENATNYAKTRLKEGVDFLKIFINDNGEEPKQEYQEIIKDISDQNNKLLISHAASFSAHELARNVGGNIITHVPKDQALNETGVQQMLEKNQTAIPTLIMSQNLIHVLIALGHTGIDYSFSNDSVALMYKMGVPIMAGTDASRPIGFVGYGESLHTELGLLHGAGMCIEDILRGATSLPANYFGLSDRGKIAPGKRADLLLLSKSPLDDISNSDKIRQVWTAGNTVFKFR